MGSGDGLLISARRNQLSIAIGANAWPTGEVARGAECHRYAVRLLVTQLQMISDA